MTFSREFKLEAVNLVRDRGVKIAQASRDLEVHENVLRECSENWGKTRSTRFPVTGRLSRNRLRSIG